MASKPFTAKGIGTRDEVNARATTSSAENDDAQWKAIIEYAKKHPSHSEAEQRELEEWLETATRIRILVTGPSGVGKSTLLNGLIGKTIFDANQDTLNPVTTSVGEYTFHEKGIDIIVFDCPGLHDGLDNEEQYIKEMLEKIEAHGGFDLILYCKRMDTPVADIDAEKEIVTTLTNGLGKLKDCNGKEIGKDIWRNCLFVLTFANVYEKLLHHEHSEGKVEGEFEKRVDEWKGVFKGVLNACRIHVPIEVAVAGFKEQRVGKCQHWLSDLWASAFEKIKESGAVALLRVNQSRFVEQPSSTELMDPEHQDIVLTKKVQKVLTAKLAAGIGAAGVAGAVTGAGIGATIGAVGIGIISFGTAASAGLVIGGVIGGAIGAAAAGGIVAAFRRYKAKKEKRDSDIAMKMS